MYAKKPAKQHVLDVCSPDALQHRGHMLIGQRKRIDMLWQGDLENLCICDAFVTLFARWVATLVNWPPPL